jgi:hypothetical protein
MSSAVVCKCCSEFYDNKSCNQPIACEACGLYCITVTVARNGSVLCTKCSFLIDPVDFEPDEHDTSPIQFKINVSQKHEGFVVNFPDSFIDAQHFTHGSHLRGVSQDSHHPMQIAIPTPDCLAFSVMAHHACLPNPGFQFTVKIRFIPFDEEKESDVDTIVLQFRRPLVVVSKNGMAHTISPRWQCRWVGGSVKMCRAIPLQYAGEHRIEMSFTRMRAIQ